MKSKIFALIALTACQAITVNAAVLEWHNFTELTLNRINSSEESLVDQPTLLKGFNGVDYLFYRKLNPVELACANTGTVIVDGNSYQAGDTNLDGVCTPNVGSIWVAKDNGDGSSWQELGAIIRVEADTVVSDAETTITWSRNTGDDTGQVVGVNYPSAIQVDAIDNQVYLYFHAPWKDNSNNLSIGVVTSLDFATDAANPDNIGTWTVQGPGDPADTNKPIFSSETTSGSWDAGNPHTPSVIYLHHNTTTPNFLLTYAASDKSDAVLYTNSTESNTFTCLAKDDGNNNTSETRTVKQLHIGAAFSSDGINFTSDQVRTRPLLRAATYYDDEASTMPPFEDADGNELDSWFNHRVWGPKLKYTNYEISELSDGDILGSFSGAPMECESGSDSTPWNKTYNYRGAMMKVYYNSTLDNINESISEDAVIIGEDGEYLIEIPTLAPENFGSWIDANADGSYGADTDEDGTEDMDASYGMELLNSIYDGLISMQFLFSGAIISNNASSARGFFVACETDTTCSTSSARAPTPAPTAAKPAPTTQVTTKSPTTTTSVATSSTTKKK